MRNDIRIEASQILSGFECILLLTLFRRGNDFKQKSVEVVFDLSLKKNKIQNQSRTRNYNITSYSPKALQSADGFKLMYSTGIKILCCGYTFA